MLTDANRVRYRGPARTINAERRPDGRSRSNIEAEIASEAGLRKLMLSSPTTSTSQDTL